MQVYTSSSDDRQAHSSSCDPNTSSKPSTPCLSESSAFPGLTSSPYITLGTSRPGSMAKPCTSSIACTPAELPGGFWQARVLTLCWQSSRLLQGPTCSNFRSPWGGLSLPHTVHHTQLALYSFSSWVSTRGLHICYSNIPESLTFYPKQDIKVVLSSECNALPKDNFHWINFSTSTLRVSILYMINLWDGLNFK